MCDEIRLRIIATCVADVNESRLRWKLTLTRPVIGAGYGERLAEAGVGQRHLHVAGRLGRGPKPTRTGASQLRSPG